MVFLPNEIQQNNMKKSVLLILIVLALASCNNIEKRGYSFELSDYPILREGLNDKSDVLTIMGSPSFVSNANNNQELWVYYSEDVKKLLFFKPEILNRKIITISFANDNKINKIIDYDLSSQTPIQFNSDYTKVANQNPSWWSRIFGNIGQVRAN